MTEEGTCEAPMVKGWAGTCDNSSNYPDGRCELHSDYSETKRGPTAVKTEALCEQLRTGVSLREAVKTAAPHSRNSHDRWVTDAERLGEKGEFGNDFVEYYALIQRAQADNHRAPHRWVREAATRIAFAVDILEAHDPNEAAVLDDYAKTLCRKADELEEEPPTIGD